MTATRADVVAEARSWLRTPYMHSQCVKGAGIDCGLLLIKLYSDLGFFAWFDPRPYSMDWHFHRDEDLYLGWVKEHAKPTANPRPGDVMLFKVGRCFSHGGIVTKSNPLTIVHAHQPARFVVEDIVAGLPRLSDPSRSRMFFTLWDD